MGYWIYRKSDNSILAVAEHAVKSAPVQEDSMKLVYDRPAPRVLAEAHIIEDGGDFFEDDEVDKALVALQRSRNRTRSLSSPGRKVVDIQAHKKRRVLVCCELARSSLLG